MSLNTSFFSLGGDSNANWKPLPLQMDWTNDCSLFRSSIHNILIYVKGSGKLFSTDLQTISILTEDEQGLYADYAYYNNEKNEFITILYDYIKQETLSYISTDVNLSTYVEGTSFPLDNYHKQPQINGDIIYGNGYYVISGAYYPNTTASAGSASCPAIFYSQDGLNWTRVLVNDTVIKSMRGKVNQVGFGNNRFLALGSYFMGNSSYKYSLGQSISIGTPDNWNNSLAPFSAHIRMPIVYCNGYFYYVTWSDQFVRSPDGINWETLQAPAQFYAEDNTFNVIYETGLYYLFDKNKIYTTTDFSAYKAYKLPYEFSYIKCSMVIFNGEIVICRDGVVYHSKVEELVQEY